MTDPAKEPAFPNSYIGNDAPHEGVGGGMSQLLYAMIHAPASEVEALIANESSGWKNTVDHKDTIQDAYAKARRLWAEAVIRESQR